MYKVEYSTNGPSFSMRHFLENVSTARDRFDGAVQKQMKIPGVGRINLQKRNLKGTDGTFLANFECTARDKSWKLFATLVTPKQQP